MKYALLVFFAAGTLAAPFLVLNDNLPGLVIKEVGCSGSRFRQGQTYSYDYAGETLNNVEGSSKQKTGLQLRARILITPLSECKFSMSVGGAELLSKDRTQAGFVKTAESAKFKQELEKNELLFTMNGNKIHSLLPHNTEPTHILNIKRAMLSAFQIDETSGMETDVNGICQATVESVKGKLVKTKKLTDCSVRGVNEIGIQTATIKTQSSLKPLDSNSKCVYVMEDSLIKSVTCKETHLFRPFSAGYESPSGAMTFVNQELKFIKYQPVMDVKMTAANYGKETSIVFDYSTEELSLSNTVDDHVDQIMDRLVKKGDLSAKQHSAHEFTSLVFLLRKMDQKRMKPIWTKYFESEDRDLKDVYRQYLLDAVAYCGTSTCVSMVRNVIIEGKVSGERMNMFLQSIALVGKTTKEMISNVLEILKKQPSRQAYLTLGTLMSRHCGSLPEECVFGNKNPITEAERYLEKKLKTQCEGQKDHERVEEILMVLKAIGNAKRPIRVRSTLIRCAKNAKHANITRAAFDAFRGMPCDGAHTDDIMKVLVNEVVDPEIRIHSFIALMKCPSESVLAHVIRALETEQSRQVASFMWSHLTNIMESSDPKNREARNILELMTKTTPLRKMDLPIHQFSRSYEKSIHLESLESGATAEGHVIFHPDGYLPKSALFNLTAQVMGVPVPIVEAIVGMDGMEAVMENVFGPDGILEDNFVFKIFNTTYTADKIREFALKRENTNQRTRRNVNDNLNKVHNKVNMKSPTPTGHFSVKIMGQEVRVMSYDDIYWMINKIDDMNVIQLMNFAATGGHKTFSKSMMFLEMTHTVPTGLGLPLKLKLVGSTVATVELDGKFDIRNMFWGRGGIQVNGYVKPSAVVELSGQMGIESHFVSSGVFVNSSMFVSNMIKGSVLYREGQKLKINLDTPEEPIQLFNFSSTPFTYINEKTDLIEGTPRKINPDVCLKSKLIGYGLCTSVRLPVAFREYEAPYFPLSGPAHFGMKLVRGDEKLTTWQFLVAMTKKKTVTTGKIEFSTPGAAYERKLNGKMVYSDVDYTRSLQLSTERYGKRAEINFSYDTLARGAAIETRNNFLTPKDFMTKLEYFNRGNMVSQHYGVSFTTEYDWYKFEHVTKYVRKATGHMLHSSTMYYPKKSVTGVLEYNTKDQKMTASLNADQLKQAVEVSGQWENESTKKGLRLVATHISSGKSASLYGGIVNKDKTKELITTVNILGKSASNVLGYYDRNGKKSIENVLMVNDKKADFSATFENAKSEKVLVLNVNVLERNANSKFSLTNTKVEKSVKVVVNVAGKTAESKFGIYNKDDTKTVKINFNINERKGEVFVNVHTAEGYRTTVGAAYGKYIAGVRGVYTNNHGHGKSLCSSAYYGTTDSEKEPVLVCTKYHSLGSRYIHKRLSFSVKLNGMDKTYELVNDYEQHTGHINLKSQVKYNDKVKAKNTYDLQYKDYSNVELKMDLEAGKYKAGWKVFSQAVNSATNMGLEGYVMDKTILFTNKYERTGVDDSNKIELTSELVINGKTLPVSTKFGYIYGGGKNGPMAKLIVGKYVFGYTTVVEYSKSKYGYVSEVVASKNTKSLVKLYQQASFTNGKDVKELIHKFGVSTLGKTYEYGWEAAYENRGTASKTAHALTFRIQYATTRKSSITFTIANGKRTAEIIADWEYIPTKHVSHSMRYTKKNRQLDISIEFLPKMFATFTARVDKNKGYSLTTDMGIKWQNYKRSLTATNTYKNTNNQLEFSTSMGKDINFAIIFSKKNPKTVKLVAQVFKYNGKIVGLMTRRNVQLRLIYNRKMLLNILGDYNKATRGLIFSVSSAQKTFFKISGDYNSFFKKVTLAVSGFGSQWFEVSGRYAKKESMVVFNVLSMKKQIFKAIAKKGVNSASLKLVSPQLKRDITFAGKINRRVKSVTISAETAGNIVGTTLRADWKNLAIGAQGFYNKFTSGWEAFVEKHAIVYKMSFTPNVFAQVIFEVQDDSILRMTVQRSLNNNIVNETSFQYTLSKGMCQFAFNWNANTIQKIIGVFRPVIKTTMEEVEKLSNQIFQTSRRLTKRAADDSQKAILSVLRNVDQTFDEFDFIDARNKVGEVTVDALRKMSTMIRSCLKAMAKELSNVAKNVPEFIHKGKELVHKGKEIAREAKKLMKNFQRELKKNFNELSQLAVKVATNLTESTRPVVNKAIQLVKDFKFRGKPMKEIVVIITNKGKEYIAFYTKEANLKFAEFKTKAMTHGAKVKDDILKMTIPYTKKNVEQVVEIIKSKISELKTKLNSIEVEQMMKDARVKVMNYKVQGKPLKKHLVVIKESFNKLPKTTRKAMLDLIKLVRTYSNIVDVKFGKAFNEVAKFAEPLTDYVTIVGKSLDKHFGPVLNLAVQQVKGRIALIRIPSVRPYFMKQFAKIEAFLLPLVKPLTPLYNNIKQQIRNIDVLGFKLGTFTDLQKDIIKAYINEYTAASLKSMNTKIEKVNTILDRMLEMTPEQMVDKFFDSATDMSTEAVAYVTKIYKDRKTLITNIRREINAVYDGLMQEQRRLRSKSFEEHMETLIHTSSEIITLYAEELSSILKQLSNLDIAGPTWKAWKDADLLNHLAKYGVNKRLSDLIKTAKSISLEKSAIDSVKMVKQFIDDIYSQLFVTAIQTYAKIENAYDYIRSIPKKEYEQWFLELKKFALSNKENFVSYITKMHKVSTKRATEIYNMAAEMSKVNYNKIYSRIYKEVVNPAQQWYTVISDKSILVYKDLKQPTIDVYVHYKDIAVKFGNKYYGVVKSKVTKEAKKIYGELKSKIVALQSKMEKEYEKFLAKYGDLSWEEVGEKVYKYGQDKTNRMMKVSKVKYNKLAKLMKKYQEKALRMYKKTLAVCKKYIKQAEDKYNEIKPKAIKMYKKYEAMGRKEVKKYMSKAKDLYVQVKTRATKVYNDNKDKTLMVIYVEIKTLIVNQIKAKYAQAETMVNKNIAKVTDLTTKYYTKADILLKTVILPELKVESESIINQTLRGSVELAEEIVKAYYPHYILAVESGSEAIVVLKEKVMTALEKSSVAAKENMDKLSKALKELQDKIQKHELYKNVVNHKYLVKTVRKIRELVKLVQNKIEELKSHPTTRKHMKAANEKIAEYKAKLGKYQAKLEKYYNEYSKHPQVTKALKTLKQMKKSGMFTINQVSRKVGPHFDASKKSVEDFVKMVPIQISDKFAAFRKNPEETFWKAVSAITLITQDFINELKKVDRTLIKEKSKAYLDMATKYSKMMLDECTDKWTKETCKQIYNDAVENINMAKNKMMKLPSELKQMLKKAYNERVAKLTKMMKDNHKYLKHQWSECPIKAFVDNQLWQEIADEVMAHELVDLSKTVSVMTKGKIIELKDLALKELAKQKVAFEAKAKELMSKASDKYDELKEKAIKKYEQLVLKYKQMVKKSLKFLEETTVADIVAFTVKTYKQAIKKVEETKLKLMKLKTKYIAEAKVLYAKYEAKAKETYTKLYKQGKKLVLKLKGKVTPHYKKYRAQAEKLYKKYYPIVAKKYADYYKKAELKYKELSVKTVELFNEYKTKVCNFIKKTKADSYKKWMDSEVRARMIVLKKMTIRETIEALKKLPKQTKVFAIATYNKYYKLASEKIQQEYAKLMQKYLVKRTQLIKMAKPYTEPTYMALKWIENEITETAVFLYKYHHMKQRYNMARDYITKEYKRIVPLVSVAAKKYAKQYKELAVKYAKEYSVIVKKSAKEFAITAGDKTLRGIHSTMRYIDNIDVKAMQAKTRAYFTMINKYISIDSTKGEIIVSIPCGITTPKFSHHIRKVQNKVRRSVDNIKQQGQHTMDKIKTELAKLKVKVQQLRDQIRNQVMENTVELRQDMQVSYKLNKKIAERVYFRLKIAAQKGYKVAVAKYNVYKKSAEKMLANAKVRSEIMYKKFLKSYRAAYLKASEILLDIYRAGIYKMHKRIAFHSKKYFTLARKESAELYNQYKPIVKSLAKKYYNIMKVKAKQAKKEIEPYYQSVKKGFVSVSKGQCIKDAFYPLYREMNFIYKTYKHKGIKEIESMKRRVCKADPKLCQHVKESMKVHKAMFDKYSVRVTNIIDAGKAHIYRAMRKTSHIVARKTEMTSSRYNAVAMIFGNKRILSFDNKFYNFLTNKNADCQYLLAHDFANDKFSLISQKDAILIKTQEMEVKIKSNGKIRATIAKKNIFSLPVESKSGKCMRKQSIVICHFVEEKFKVVVDLKYFVTTVSMSGWHYGKSRGLLGTNNRESYDDWKLPNGRMAKNIYNFQNAYEITGKGKCQLNQKKIDTPSCTKTPSAKCSEIFKQDSSAYAHLFKNVDPEPFRRACELETADCDNKASKDTVHCSSVAAYVSMSRARGYWARHLPECMSVESHSIGDEWTQKPIKKAVDVVVMVSQQKNVFASRGQVAKLIGNLNKKFKNSGYKTRYALIGFGGAGIHEKAHSHPLGTGHDVFGNAQELTTEIKAMPYKGTAKNTNDGYHAILAGSRLRFRPGASKVFILYNTEPHSSHEHGPAFDEAIYALNKEVDATLFAFDKFEFKNIRGAGKVIGQTTNKLYTTKRIKGLPQRNLDFPTSEFTAMAEASNGGWFSSRVKSPRHVATSLYDAITYRLRIDSEFCQQCRIETSWTGISRALCHTQKELKC